MQCVVFEKEECPEFMITEKVCTICMLKQIFVMFKEGKANALQSNK